MWHHPRPGRIYRTPWACYHPHVVSPEISLFWDRNLQCYGNGKMVDQANHCIWALFSQFSPRRMKRYSWKSISQQKMQIRNSWRTTNNAKWLGISENSKSLNYYQQWKLEIHTNKKCGNMCKYHLTTAINSPSLSSSLFGVVIHSPRCHPRSLQFIKHDPQKYPKNDHQEGLWNNIGILDNGGTVISASLFNRLDRTSCAIWTTVSSREPQVLQFQSPLAYPHTLLRCPHFLTHHRRWLCPTKYLSEIHQCIMFHQAAFIVVFHGWLVHGSGPCNDLRFVGVLRHSPEQHWRPNSGGSMETWLDQNMLCWHRQRTHQSRPRNELRTAFTNAFRRSRPASSSVWSFTGTWVTWCASKPCWNSSSNDFAFVCW